MRAGQRTCPERLADGVFAVGGVNGKDVVLVDVPESADDARATVRVRASSPTSLSGSSSFEAAQAAGRG